MFRYIKPYKLDLIIILFLMIFFSLATATGPILLMITIDQFGSSSSENLFGILFLDNFSNDIIRSLQSITSLDRLWVEVSFLATTYLILQLIVFYVSYKRVLMIAEVGLKAEMAMRLDLFEHLQELDLSYHDKNEVGRIMSRLTSDLRAIREMLGGQVLNNIANMLTVFVVLIIILRLDVILSIIPLVLIPIVIFIGTLSKKFARPRRKETRRTNSILMANIAESISGIKVTKGMNREDQNIRVFQELNEANYSANVSADDMNAIFFPIMLTMSTIGVAIIIYVGSLRIISGAITVGALVAFLNYNAILFRPVVLLGQFYQQLQDALTGAERIYALLDTETQVPWNTHFPDLPPIEGEVVFNRLYFEYVENDPVYEQFSLFVPSGKTIALVGKTGAGKSTIINILSRMYDFQKGQLLIDNTNIKDVNLPSYRAQIAAVPQDFFLFSTSIRENLKLGNPLASEDEMWFALEKVGLKEYVLEMEQGLDTPLQERGGRLSVGQRQLLVFAAVLLANPRILILDEATSSIDVFSEMKIQNAIKLLLADRTSFIIAHRLSTIRNADTIVVIEDGNIVEQGTHDELLKIKGHYFRLVKNQIELSEV